MPVEFPNYSDGFRTRIRREKSEFRRIGDARSWTEMRDFLLKTIPYYEDVYARVEPLLIDWHKARVEIVELPISSGLIKKAKEIEDRHMEPYKDPKSKSYIPDYAARFSPALRAISSEVSRTRK